MERGGRFYFESVHVKIHIILFCKNLKISGLVKADHKRIVKSTITSLLETTLVFLALLSHIRYLLVNTLKMVSKRLL